MFLCLPCYTPSTVLLWWMLLSPLPKLSSILLLSALVISEAVGRPQCSFSHSKFADMTSRLSTWRFNLNLAWLSFWVRLRFIITFAVMTSRLSTSCFNLNMAWLSLGFRLRFSITFAVVTSRLSTCCFDLNLAWLSLRLKFYHHICSHDTKAKYLMVWPEFGTTLIYS